MATEVRPNYLIKVTLVPRWITNPAISRTLSVPANSTFLRLHKALQIAFGWSDIHLFDFKVTPEYGEAGSEVLITDRDGMEAVRVSAEISAIMRENGDHPFTEAPRETELKNFRRTRLWQVFDEEKHQGKCITYEYDKGDCWDHEIEIIGRDETFNDVGESNQGKFFCSGGTGHPAAEDGKIIGWEELKEAYRTEDPDEEQQEQIQWYERRCINGDKRGLRNGREYEWDTFRVNGFLRIL